MRGRFMLGGSKMLLSEKKQGQVILATNKRTSFEKKERVLGAEKNENEGPMWIPHPRTGIYYPKGQEAVMEGVPDTAASLRPTFWFRALDGVDSPRTFDAARHDLSFRHD